MRISSFFRNLAILALVVTLSPQPVRAQEAGLPKISLPQLPPLPGAPTPPPQPVAEAPKLPQLKTIPEIPPAKQVAAGAPVEKGWMDKLKDLVAKFEDKPATPAPAPKTQIVQVPPVIKPPVLQTAKITPPTSVTAPIVDQKIALPPPPTMEPPVMDALNLGSETPTVDPDIFEFDEVGKKTLKKPKTSGSVIPLPLPPRAKVNSAERVTVPVMPNPVKSQAPLSEPKIIATTPFKPAPLPLAAIPTPPPVPAPLPLAAIPAPAKLQPLPLPPLETAKVTPPAISSGMPKLPPLQESWVDKLKDKAATAKEAILAKAQEWTGEKKTQTASATKKPADNEVKYLKPKPGIMIDAAPPPPPTPELAQKAPLFGSQPLVKPQAVTTAKAADPSAAPWPELIPLPVRDSATVTNVPLIPLIKLPPSTPQVAGTTKAPPIPDLTPLPKPEIATKTDLPSLPAPVVIPKPETTIAEKAPVMPPIPELQPLPKPEIAATIKEPALPKHQIAQASKPPVAPEIPLPKIDMPLIVAKTPPPPAPEIPPLAHIPIPKPEMQIGNKAPSIPQIQPLPKPELPQFALKTPKTPMVPPTPHLPAVQTATNPTPQIPMLPTSNTSPPPLPALTLGDLKLPGDANKPPRPAAPPKPEVAVNTPAPKVEPDTFEFGELNNKGKKGQEKKDELVIADISKDDPAFKFWKGHDFNTQVLPSVINSKEYATRNSHLPKAVYREDLEQLLFVAAGRGDLNALRALLNNSIDIEAKNAIGDTLLVHAAINGQAGAVRVLLARGANPNNPNVHGMTAMQVAAEHGREDIIDALFEMGAKATADYRNPLTPLQSGVGRGFASVYNAMQEGENPKKKELDARNRALQALADAGPAPRTVISQGMPGLSKQIIDDEARKKPGEALTFDEIERKLAYQEYVRKTGDDPAANAMNNSTLPKLISPAGVKATPVPIPYTSPQPQVSQNPPPPPGYTPPSQREPIVGLPPEQKPR